MTSLDRRNDVARLRAGHQRHVPDHHARRPGPGRRDRAAGGAVDRDEHVRRGRRAQQGAQRLEWQAFWVTGLTALAAVPVTFLLIRRAELARATAASLQHEDTVPVRAA
jgi:hypothetical protein